MCMFFWESFVFQYGLFIPENTKAANVCVCSHRVFVNLLLKCYSLNECTVCIICLKTWSWYRNTWNLIFQFFFSFFYIKFFFFKCLIISKNWWEKVLISFFFFFLNLKCFGMKSWFFFCRIIFFLLHFYLIGPSVYNNGKNT